MRDSVNIARREARVAEWTGWTNERYKSAGSGNYARVRRADASECVSVAD